MADTVHFVSKTLSSQRQLLFHELKVSSQFSDVTLVTDDHVQVGAHKFLLYSNSRFFKTIFDTISNSNVVYLKGIKADQLQKILEFVYLGEVKVPNDRVEAFIEAAKDLAINDIDNDKNRMADEVASMVQHYAYEAQVKPELVEEQIESFIETLQSKSALQRNANYPCGKCEFSAIHSEDLKSHEETVHQKLNIYEQEKTLGCNICSFRTTNDTILKRHIMKHHENFHFKCKHCSFEARGNEELTLHMKSIHAASNYNCNFCPYQTFHPLTLRAHIRAIHKASVKLLQSGIKVNYMPSFSS